MSEKVIVGGTFDHLHYGHKKLLETALERGETTIGLVSDEMLKDWKPDVSSTFEERKERLEEFLLTWDDWKIVEISDPYEKAVEGDFDVIVVSHDTRERGKKINEMREEKGKTPLEIVKVEPVIADDLMPISSTRIREGKINEAGERIKPVKINLGTNNEVKVDVVDDVLSRFFECEINRENVEDIDAQPFNEEIIKGARKRACVKDDFDYGVGIESGIINAEEGNYSVEFCAIDDREGKETTGHGPGFLIPEDWVDDLRDGVTLQNKIKVMFDGYEDDLGAIGLLTNGEVTRTDCIESAIMTAMIPRLKGDIYY